MSKKHHLMSKKHHLVPIKKDLGEFFADLNKKLEMSALFHGKIYLKKHPASKTELIGTLVHSGFDLLTEQDKDGHLHFTLKKVANSGSLDEIKKSKRFIFKQERIGKGGKKINILKLRTMYPMAHKAQDYLYKKVEPGPYGKPLSDFRITPHGRFFRKYWIDELMQLANILKGEMKLVGLRPLSEGFYKSLPKSLQRERIKHLPGLMAAIYADAPKNLEARIKSEIKYLEQKRKHPVLTDIKYFFRVLWSILFRGQRGY